MTRRPSHVLWLACLGLASPARPMADDVALDSPDGHLQACLSGAFMFLPEPACADARFDRDGDVDAYDPAILRDCLSGPSVPADLHCAY